MTRHLLTLLFVLVGPSMSAQTVLTQGAPANLHGVASPESFTFSPQQGWWNGVAVGSGTTNASAVAIDIGGKSSSPSPSYGNYNNNFLLSNGNWGTIASTAGSATASGSYSNPFSQASLYHAQVSSVVFDAGPSTVNLTRTTFPGTPSVNVSGQFIHLWEVYVNPGEEGVRNIKVTKSGNLLTWNWSVFAPGTNTAWVSRMERTYGEYSLSSTNDVNQSINFSQPGYWCVAVFSEYANGVDSAGTTVSVQVSTPSSSGGVGGGDDESCSTGEGSSSPWRLLPCLFAAVVLSFRQLRQRRGGI
ncbi:MAG: hypothetical protein M5U25_11530 [Planctomycetota bacterium]|nr:hypothetical protein [Planctomycetota bacterium]